MPSSPPSRTPFSTPGLPHSIDSPDMRRAGRELLSLALIDARNHTLHLLSLYEQALGSAVLAVPRAGGRRAAALAGRPHRLVRRVVDRAQHAARLRCRMPGAADAPGRDRAAGRRWWNPAQIELSERWSPEMPDLEQTKAYLLETLESTLELLEHAAETDAGLYFYRLALFHEDLRGEQLVVMAQTLGLPLGVELPARARSAREPLLLPATRMDARLRRAGFAFAQERGAHAGGGAGVRDRCPARHLEPVRGVRRRRRLRPRGTVAARRAAPGSSAQTEGRRGPRHVEQIGAARHGTGGSVLQQRFGRTVRAAGNQSAVHVSWWEADAWARWAGRRIATEVEWEIAAHTAARRGFRWADVHEWTAGTLQPWPGFRADPWSAGTEFDPQPAFGRRACCAALRSRRARACVRRSAAALRGPSATTASSVSDLRALNAARGSCRSGQPSRS